MSENLIMRHWINYRDFVLHKEHISPEVMDCLEHTFFAGAIAFHELLWTASAATLGIRANELANELRRYREQSKP